MNLVICKKGSNKIEHFIHNCIQRGGKFHGDGKAISGVNPNKFDVYWTNDSVNLVDGNYDKTLDQLTVEAEGIKVSPPSYADYATALTIRKLITTLTFSEIETYVNNNVNTLAEAKVFLIRLAKVVLALSKIIDQNYTSEG